MSAPRPPFETFKRPTCRGCYAFGTACGTCEKCAWERQQAGFTLDYIAPAPAAPTIAPAWPKDTNSFKNVWNHDIVAFAKLIAEHPMLWLCDSRLKYLSVRIDTRDGGFVITDRDGNAIEPERVVAAAAESKERFDD